MSALIVSNGVQDGSTYTSARAWVAINGSASPTIRASYNVSSVSFPSSPGTYYAVNLASAVSSGYCIVTSGGITAGGGFPSEFINAASTSQFYWYVGQNANTYSHNSYACAIIYS